MRGSVPVSLRVPESDHHTENLQFLKVLEKQKKSIVLYLLRGGAEWLYRLYMPDARINLVGHTYCTSTVILHRKPLFARYTGQNFEPKVASICSQAGCTQAKI